MSRIKWLSVSVVLFLNTLAFVACSQPMPVAVEPVREVQVTVETEKVVEKIVEVVVTREVEKTAELIGGWADLLDPQRIPEPINTDFSDVYANMLLYDPLINNVTDGRYNSALLVDAPTISVDPEGTQATIYFNLDPSRLQNFNSPDILRSLNQWPDVYMNMALSSKDCQDSWSEPDWRLEVNDELQLQLHFNIPPGTTISPIDYANGYLLNVVPQIPIFGFDDDGFMGTGPIQFDANGEIKLNQQHPMFEEVSPENLLQMQQDITDGIPVPEVLSGCDKCEQDPSIPDRGCSAGGGAAGGGTAGGGTAGSGSAGSGSAGSGGGISVDFSTDGTIVSGNPQSGSISSPGLVDNWKFFVNAGQIVTIDLKAANSQLDTVLEVFANGSERLFQNNNASLGTTDSHIEREKIKESGEYLIRVSGYKNSYGAYRLVLTVDNP